MADPDHRFEVDARFVLDPGSDGIDVAGEAVEITFGTFVRTLPAGAFKRQNAHKFVFGDRTLTIDLWNDGRVEIRGKRLDLSGIDPTLPVTVG